MSVWSTIKKRLASTLVTEIMNQKTTLMLIALSAIWGASFLFMRVASAEFGPLTLIFLRMLGAILVLAPFLMRKTLRSHIFESAKHIIILSMANNVVPFVLLAYATLKLESGFTSLINATTPMWTALIAVGFFGTKVNRQQIVGLILAFLGIFILSADKLTFGSQGMGWSILAGLGATLGYGIAGNYSKRYLSHLSAKEITVGTVLSSTLILTIPGLYFWPEVSPSTTAWVSTALLGILCTAVAYLIFFKVLAEAGSVATSTVTFLVPVFAIAWGVSLLGEQITLRMMIGMAMTLLGTALSVKLIKSWPFKRPLT